MIETREGAATQGWQPAAWMAGGWTSPPPLRSLTEAVSKKNPKQNPLPSSLGVEEGRSYKKNEKRVKPEEKRYFLKKKVFEQNPR